jgi:subtilase family serine protease
MPFPSRFIRPGTRTGRFRARLSIEPLESRTLLSIYTPAQIVHAYGIDNISFDNGALKGNGSGQTIAIVDAYYDPTIQQDIATFSSTFGLPQLDGLNGDGKFTQLDLSKGTLSPSGDDWTIETALDVEWAHAVAPKANILLVEAANDSQDASTGEPTALLNAVQTAAATSGVSTVSMSWGIGEVPGETSWDSYFSKPGVTFVAASGDSGAGTIWPAVSPNVVSVGGTTLTLTSSNTISRETGWGNGNLSYYYGGSGGGFSEYEPLPSYQRGITTVDNGWKLTSFGVRLNPDVAYVANPNTGLYVLDGADGGWYQVGGTSAGAPQWAALVAIADQGRALSGLSSLSSSQTLTALYANPSDFHDITSGSTGTYDVVNSSGQVVGTIPVVAGVGYDMVTGLGTPIANVLAATLARVSTSNAAPAATTAAIKSASGGSKSGSSSLAVTSSFLAALSLSNPARPVAFATTPGPVVTATPPLAGSTPVNLPASLATGPVASNSPSVLPSAVLQSGGGDNVGDDTLDEDAAPGDNVPVGSLPKEWIAVSPGNALMPQPSGSGLAPVASGVGIRDAYFSALGIPDSGLQPVEIASPEDRAESASSPRPQALAALLGLMFAGYLSFTRTEDRSGECGRFPGRSR